MSVIAKDMGLLIIIKEDGTPFTPGMEHEFSPEAIQPKPQYGENNSFFIEKLMDKVWFHSFGKDGLEI